MGKKTEGTQTVRDGPDPRLLEILVCPVSQSVLQYDAEKSELVSAAAGLAYPVRGNVPIMLMSEARQLDPDG